MNEIVLIVIAIVDFFFGLQIRPWIEKKYPEIRHTVDLMVMAVTITMVLIPLISIIGAGSLPIGTYYIVLSFLLSYFIYYGIQHRKELTRKSRKTYYGLLIGYSYIFLISGIAMFWFAPFMPKITL